MDSIVRFFDVSPGLDVVNPMFGPPHLIAIVGLVGIVLAMLLVRRQLREVPIDGRLVRGVAWFILLDQLLLFGLYFIYDYQPFWERFPLHLCAWLCLFVPAMTLLGRMDAVRYVALWGVGSGTLAVVNMSLAYNPVTSYVFFHYLWMHYYLVAFPVFLALQGRMNMSYVDFLRSMAGLLALSVVIFALDWLVDANYMYIGPSSTLDVPFVPADWRVWPWSYPTFMFIGIAIFHVIYAAFRPLIGSPHEPRPSNA